MLLNYRLSTEAEVDLFEAYVWYEGQKNGLGEEFLLALDNARHSILANPSTYKIIFKKRVRAYSLQRFPFQVLYFLEKSEVNVIAVFNTYRSPNVWKERVS